MLEGLVLYPFILISEKKENTSIITLKHEFIHIEQIKKYGVFYFYYKYLTYILKFWKETDDITRGFIENEFEEEAYKMGFQHAAVGAMVRSSYHADVQAHNAGLTNRV